MQLRRRSVVPTSSPQCSNNAVRLWVAPKPAHPICR